MNAVTLRLWHRKFAADDTEYQRHWQILAADELTRAAAINNERLHKRYVIVHGLLRTILSETVNEPPKKLNINKTGQGKPYLTEYPELAFNLSHTEDTMVIAVGKNCRLGVDIETCKPRVNLPALVDKCFAEVEAVWWRKLPETEKNREFYRFWTRKEAFVKATGHGIALGLNLCIINPENPATWLSVPVGCGQASSWHVRDVDLGKDVCSALVADKTISDIKLISI